MMTTRDSHIASGLRGNPMSLPLNLDSSHDDVCGVGETVSRSLAPSLALSPFRLVSPFSLSLSLPPTLLLSLSVSLSPQPSQTHTHNDLEMHMGWLRLVGSVKL